jgi:hypothetical protein
MSESSPADLAVAFRSIPRRLREALEPLNGDTRPVRGLLGELMTLIDDAARTLDCPASMEEIADAIEAVPADGWDADDLKFLRGHALDAGRLMRSIATAAEDADG